MKHFLGDSKEMMPTKCLNCGYVFDMAAAIDKNVSPKPDDISICMRCGHLSVYTKNMELRELTGEEMIKCAGDERIIAVQEVIKRIHPRRK